MSEHNDSFTSVPFPKIRRLMVDGGQLGHQRHTIHGLFEMDVTRPRQFIREHKAQTGETLSFTALIMACLGRAIDMNKHMHAYRSWRDKLILFDEVDINSLFAVQAEGREIIRPHVIRAVNKKTFRELHDEIRVFQAGHAESREASFIGWFVRLPGFIRRTFLRILYQNPQWQKDMAGTVLLTAIGMFGEGGGWGIPVSNHTLQVTLGGIDEKPGVVEGRIEVREYLSVTLSFDHDIIDGAPAARFAQRLKELIESGYGLDD